MPESPATSEISRTARLTTTNQSVETVEARRANALSLFEARAEAQPQAVALIFEDERLAYYQLNARANQLARHLRKLGVQRETHVAICLERSPELIVGILATLKAGGVYVPLDPRYPHERTVFMLQDSNTRILLTQESLAARWHEYVGQVVCLDSDWPVISQLAAENLCDSVRGDNLAYIIYTSGSSGAPKGVMITHNCLSHYLRFLNEPLGLTPGDVCLHTASFAFSSSVRQLMLPLAHGAAVVIASTEQILNPLMLFDYVKRRSVTIMDLVPSHWRSVTYVLASLTTEERSTLLDNELRLILSASEPLLSDVPKIWSAQCKPETSLLNMYGQTETTGIVATYPISAADCEAIKAVPLGRPIANTRFYILDEHLQPVPVGVTGQLYVAGAGLGRGYLNRPDLTAERFIPNPFGRIGGRRLYRTGDLARYLSCGNFEYVGRSDEQVKIRGHRVELREVGAALSRHPAVREALAVVRDLAGEQRLIAYIVAQGEVTARELGGYLRAHLPEYMIPSSIVLLKAFPLSANGKVDRRSLPQPDQRTLRTMEAYSAPRTTTEEVVADIWGDVLTLRPVGIHDNFFELGGESLLATQVLSRLREAVGVQLLLGTFFEAPTVAGLAEQIEAARKAGAELMPERIPRIARED